MGLTLQQLRARKTGDKVMDMQHRVQVNEAIRDANTGFSTPTIMVPKANGEMVSSAEYKLDKMAPHLEAVAMRELASYHETLKTQKLLTVTNHTEKWWVSSVNGERYRIAPGQTKQLPEDLAQHFVHKMDYARKLRDYERRMGAITGVGEVPHRDWEDFKREVQYFDQDQVDLGQMRHYW
jgi:hypothetical protein